MFCLLSSIPQCHGRRGVHMQAFVFMLPTVQSQRSFASASANEAFQTFVKFLFCMILHFKQSTGLCRPSFSSQMKLREMVRLITKKGLNHEPDNVYLLPRSTIWVQLPIFNSSSVSSFFMLSIFLHTVSAFTHTHSAY